MKKSLLHATVAALLLAGCAQNEITDISPDAAPPVGFKVFTDAQTRGLVTNSNATSTGVTTGIQTTGFGVFAYYTGQGTWAVQGASTTPNFMYNQKVTYSGGWTYTPVKFWPNTEGDKISFFAYAPHSTTSNSGIAFTTTTTTATGAPKLNFTLQTTPQNMVDLVATDATQTGADKTIDVQKQTSNVSFKLKHVLTRASFKAKLDASLTSTVQTHVFITDMRILGTAKRDDPKNTGNSVTANTASKFYKTGIYQWSDGLWATASFTKQDDPYPLAGILNTAPLVTTNDAYKAGYTTSCIELPQAATETSLFKSNQYAFLLPPDNNTGISNATDVRVQLDYDIVTLDPNLANKHSITSTTATVSLPNGTLQLGKAYIFTFTVGLEKVQVNAKVEEWAAEQGVYVPSADVTTASAAAVNTALATLTTAKQNNKNCNYFVVNITANASGGSWTLSGASTYFVSGDKIELKFTSGSTLPTVTLSGWKVTSDSSNKKIILTKN